MHCKVVRTHQATYKRQQTNSTNSKIILLIVDLFESKLSEERSEQMIREIDDLVLFLIIQFSELN